MALPKNPALAYYTEGANNTAPDFAVTKLRLLRLVSENLNPSYQRDESNEIRGDAQSSGSVITAVSGGGSIQIQYSLDTFDDLLAGMLYADDDAGTGRTNGWLAGGFTAQAAVMAGGAGAVTFDATNNRFTSSALFAVLAEDARIFVSGFGNKNLDTVFVVETGSDASNIELKNDTGVADIATYAGVSADVVGTDILIQSVQGYTRNGTGADLAVERTFGLVRFYSNIGLAGQTSTTGLDTVDWALFRGCVMTSLQLAVAPGTAGWTGAFSVLLKDEFNISVANGNQFAGFDVDNWDEIQLQNAYSLANAIGSVKMVRLRKGDSGGHDVDSVRVDPLSFNINAGNNAQEVSATRNAGAIAINQGTFSAQVAISLLYIDPTYHQAMIDDEAYEVEIAVADAEGHCQLWRFPRARLTSERPNPGKNNPIQNNLTFTCEAGGDLPYVGAAGSAKTLEILRFYAPAA